MEHERMRFRTMNLRQLEARLYKIKSEEKLERFIIVAGDYGYENLQWEAKRKLAKMRGISLRENKPNQKVEKKEFVKRIPAPSKEEKKEERFVAAVRIAAKNQTFANLQRALDF